MFFSAGFVGVLPSAGFVGMLHETLAGRLLCLQRVMPAGTARAGGTPGYCAGMPCVSCELVLCLSCACAVFMSVEAGSAVCAVGQ